MIKGFIEIGDYIIPRDCIYIRQNKETGYCLIYNIYTNTLIIPTPLVTCDVLLCLS